MCPWCTVSKCTHTVIPCPFDTYMYSLIVSGGTMVASFRLNCLMHSETAALVNAEDLVDSGNSEMELGDSSSDEEEDVYNISD
jgi:hypothetical protein